MTKTYTEVRFFKWKKDDTAVSLRAKSASYGGERGTHNMWQGINGDTAFTLDGHYYLGCGNRGGREREVVYWTDDMQNTTGTLSPGKHPGSYNGQDAYNDMLVVDDGICDRQRTSESVKAEQNGRRAELYARSASDYRGG